LICSKNGSIPGALETIPAGKFFTLKYFLLSKEGLDRGPGGIGCKLRPKKGDSGDEMREMDVQPAAALLCKSAGPPVHGLSL
jgi:hypothetical protein